MNKFINGKKHGFFQHYWSNSDKLRAEGNYINNSQDGLWKFYHGNGDLCLIGLCLNNQQIGPWTSYYEGNIMCSKQFYL